MTRFCTIAEEQVQMAAAMGVIAMVARDAYRAPQCPIADAFDEVEPPGSVFAALETCGCASLRGFVLPWSTWWSPSDDARLAPPVAGMIRASHCQCYDEGEGDDVCSSAWIGIDWAVRRLVPAYIRVFGNHWADVLGRLPAVTPQTTDAAYAELSTALRFTGAGWQVHAPDLDRAPSVIDAVWWVACRARHAAEFRVVYDGIVDGLGAPGGCHRYFLAEWGRRIVPVAVAAEAGALDVLRRMVEAEQP